MWQPFSSIFFFLIRFLNGGLKDVKRVVYVHLHFIKKVFALYGIGFNGSETVVGFVHVVRNVKEFSYIHSLASQ